jgi:peroxiredoxin
VELVALQKVVSEIEGLGATLVAISPQLPEHSRELIRSRGLTFEVLSDGGNEVAGRFGLTFTLPEYPRALYATFPLDLGTYNGDDSWTLPMPARFVIDQRGVIRYADSDPDYITRPEPVVHGVQGALPQDYGAPEGPPVASTLDLIVAGVAG